jgi:hypothetical protein
MDERELFLIGGDFSWQENSILYKSEEKGGL